MSIGVRRLLVLLVGQEVEEMESEDEEVILRWSLLVRSIGQC